MLHYQSLYEHKSVHFIHKYSIYVYVVQDAMLFVLVYLLKRNVLVRVICNVTKRKAHHILYALQKIMIYCIKAQKFYCLTLSNFAPSKSK
jgi:hypothetical protein